MNILVTGGTGTLGRPTVRRLVGAGHNVSASTRSPVEPHHVRLDLSTGRGARAVVVGSDVIVHLASDTRKFGKADLAGTQALLDTASTVGTPHFVYISIVGCDVIPFPYYRRKTEVEEAIEESGVPFTILRTTQYHDFVAYVTDQLMKSYVTVIPKGVAFQPLDVEVAARRLAELAVLEPQGRVPDLGGPEVLPWIDMAREYAKATGRSRPMIATPMFGAAYRGFAAGKHHTPNADQSGATWHDWLEAIDA